jgi:flagellar assembly protein FliH
MYSLPVSALGKPAAFVRDTRFVSLKCASAQTGQAGPAHDRVAEAYERGYRDGVATAAEQACRLEQERDDARSAIELAFARLDEDSAAELRDRLRQTVLSLCEAAVLPLALDADGLAARVGQAVSMLQRAQDERVVRLNPDDLELVASRLPPDLTVKADPSVERGGLRIETADGGIEDGPSHWRQALAEAFREC